MSRIFYYPNAKVGIFIQLAGISIKTITFETELPKGNCKNMKDNSIEHSHIKSKLQYLLPYISLSTIAKDYFGKTRQWFYQRLNESQENGKTVKFTQKELVALSQALCEIGVKMQDNSKAVINVSLQRRPSCGLSDD